jgi:hypothetical protein
VAQTKKKRRRKHRGTQGGRIDRGRTARPRTREEAKARARTQRTVRTDAPPTWRSATIRGVIAAGLFVVLLILIFGRSAGSALAFGAFMLAFYIPAGYYMDQLLWRRRMRAEIRSQQKDR